MDLNHPAMTKKRTRRKPQSEWEKMKDTICELYATKNLSEVVTTLREKHDIYVTKRQLVYRLDKWGQRRYNTNPPTSSESPNSSESPGAVKTNSAQSDPSTTRKHLTGLVLKYRNQRRSTTTLIDNDISLRNAFHLHVWKVGAISAIETAYVRSTSDATIAAATKYLSDGEHLQRIIKDEDPRLLSTILAVWKQADSADNSGQASTILSSVVHSTCEKLFGPNHPLTSIFLIFNESSQTLKFDLVEDVEKQSVRVSTEETRSVVKGRPGMSQAQRRVPLMMQKVSRATSHRGMPASPLFERPSQLLERYGNTHGAVYRVERTLSSPEPQTRESENKRIVDDIMREFLENFDAYLEEIYDEGAAGNDTDRVNRKACESQSQDEGVPQTSDSRKRKGSGNPDYEDGGVDGNEADAGKSTIYSVNFKRQKLDPRGERERETLLACPYFKWNPRKYRHHRVCVSQGWTSVHLLKEHLQLRHQKAMFQCRRCHQDLKAEAALEKHQRENPPCEVSKSCDKYGAEIASSLRNRPDRNKPEVDQWIEMYKILFDVLDHELPTPYCEDFDLDIQSESWPEHVQRESRPLLRELLASEVAQALANIAPEIQNRLRDIVRKLEPTLKRSYDYSQEQERAQECIQIRHGERNEDGGKEEANSQAAWFHPTPFLQSRYNIPSSSNPFSMVPSFDADAMQYTSSFHDPPLPQIWYSTPEEHLDPGFSIPTNTWARESYTHNGMQAGGSWEPSIVDAGSFSVQESNDPGQTHDQSGTTGSMGFSFNEGDASLDDTNIYWSQWQSGFHGTHDTSHGDSGEQGEAYVSNETE